jgi:hypothetical protein
MYTVGASDTERSAGSVPISCMIQNSTGSSTTIAAFNDGNSLAIHTSNNNDNGSTGTSTGTTGTTTGTIGGTVTGGTSTSTDMGTLAVTSIDQVQSVATADGSFEHGWVWTFNITVPSNEPSVSMKFGNWMGSDASSTIAAGNNMRISSAQSDSSSTTAITGADTYSAAMNITGDLDPVTPGRQIQVKVETSVPVNTVNGAYSTSYGVHSM